MPEFLVYAFWVLVGTGVGIFLGWWQSRSIKKFENSTPEKMMGRVYLGSLPRILLISAILFIAMTQHIWYGISYAIGFTISRWLWTWITLRKLKRKDE